MSSDMGPLGLEQTTRNLWSNNLHRECSRGRLAGFRRPLHGDKIRTEGSVPGRCNPELYSRAFARFDQNVGRVDAEALGRFDLQFNILLKIIAPLQRDGNVLGLTLFDVRVEGRNGDRESHAFGHAAASWAERLTAVHGRHC
jgi:hypothetical protein